MIGDLSTFQFKPWIEGHAWGFYPIYGIISSNEENYFHAWWEPHHLHIFLSYRTHYKGKSIEEFVGRNWEIFNLEELRKREFREISSV